MNTVPPVTSVRPVDAPAAIVTLLTHPMTLLFARVMLALPFLVAGLFKLTNFSAAETEMASIGAQPAAAFAILTILVELGGSALLILNRWTWLAAGALGVFTVLATFLAHRFWEFSGQAQVDQLNTFLEHAAISAGFILVAAVSFLTARERRT